MSSWYEELKLTNSAFYNIEYSLAASSRSRSSALSMRITVCVEKLTHKIWKDAFPREGSGQPLTEREKKALTPYCEELINVSKKTTFDISITLDRHNLNFDIGKLVYSCKYRFQGNTVWFIIKFWHWQGYSWLQKKTRTVRIKLTHFYIFFLREIG
jgi:hypothetical protein